MAGQIQRMCMWKYEALAQYLIGVLDKAPAIDVTHV